MIGTIIVLGIVAFFAFCFGVYVGKTYSNYTWIRFFKEYDENSMILIRAYQDMMNGAAKYIRRLEKRIELGYDPEEENQNG